MIAPDEFGKLVHELLRPAVDALEQELGYAKASDIQIENAFEEASKVVHAAWPLERPVPPRLLWTNTVDYAKAMALAGSIRIVSPCFSTMAPTTRPFSFTRLTAREDDHSGIRRSSAVRSSRAASPLPFTSRTPRPCTTTSRPWASILKATKAADVRDRVAFRKRLRSGPLFNPMSMNVDSRIRWASEDRSAPSFASVKRQRMDRPALLRAAGMIGMIIGIVVAQGELHLVVFLEEAVHCAGIVQERVDPPCVEMVSGLV